MNKPNDHLENLSEIRSMMERSSRFISLSGLTGVFAGIFALAGAFAAFKYLETSFFEPASYRKAYEADGSISADFYRFFITNAVIVLVASLTAGVYFTWRKARRNDHRVWDHTAKRMLINLFIPLVTGGLFCLILLYHGHVSLIAPAMLIFYGIALLNASKYTLNDIRFLGICEIILGLIAAVFVGYGLLFWSIGFGVLHIVYGMMMYKKYEA